MDTHFTRVEMPCPGLSSPQGHLITLLGLQYSVLGSPMPGCLPHPVWALTGYIHQVALLQTCSLPSSGSDLHIGQTSWVVTVLLDLSSDTLLWATVALSFEGRCLP